MSSERRRRIVTAAADLAAIGALNPESDVDVLRAWVRLEAIAKARGSGIGVLLTEEGVIGGAARSAGETEKPSLASAALDVAPPYIAAIAADKLPTAISVRCFPERAEALQDFLR